jgi:hypothetical protein
VLAIDVLRATDALGVPASEDAHDKLTGLEFAAALNSELLGDPPAGSDLHKAIDVVTETIATIRNDAASSRFVGYSWSPLAMAAMLVMRYQTFEILPTLLDALTDPNVAAGDKVHALHELTRDTPPASVRREVKNHFATQDISFSGKLDHHFFFVPAEHLEVAGRNFLLAFDLLPPGVAQESILRDAGSRDKSVRAETASGCLWAAISVPMAEWPLILLLQLSHDREPVVRSSASQGLADLSMRPHLAIREAVQQRVSQLLNEPGIAIPLGALKGLYSAETNATAPDRSLWCRNDVNALLNKHPSRTVRTLAKNVLDRYDV